LTTDTVLAAPENIHPSLIGLAVDYMTRAISGKNIEKAFSISLQGASLIGEPDYARSLLKKLGLLLLPLRNRPLYGLILLPPPAN